MTDADYARYNAGWTKAPLGASVSTPLMPFQILGMATLPRSSDAGVPDMVAEQHPIFEPLLGLSNSPFQFVRVDRFVDLDDSLFVPSERGSESVSKTWKTVLCCGIKSP